MTQPSPSPRTQNTSRVLESSKLSQRIQSPEQRISCNKIPMAKFVGNSKVATQKPRILSVSKTGEKHLIDIDGNAFKTSSASKTFVKINVENLSSQDYTKSTFFEPSLSKNIEKLLERNISRRNAKILKLPHRSLIPKKVPTTRLHVSKVVKQNVETQTAINVKVTQSTNTVFESDKRKIWHEIQQCETREIRQDREFNKETTQPNEINDQNTQYDRENREAGSERNEWNKKEATQEKESIEVNMKRKIKMIMDILKGATVSTRMSSELIAIALAMTLLCITLLYWILSTYFEMGGIIDMFDAAFETIRNWLFLPERPTSKIELLYNSIRNLFNLNVLN